MTTSTKDTWASLAKVLGNLSCLAVIFVFFMIVPIGSVRADKLKSQTTVYSEHAKAIHDKIKIDRKDLENSIMNCTSAVLLGGYGPTCKAAAEDASELIKNLRVWTEEAESLKPADNDREFHAKFLENINCQRDLTILDRDIARATQTRNLSKSLELQTEKGKKDEICFKMNLKIGSGLIEIKYK